MINYTEVPSTALLERVNRVVVVFVAAFAEGPADIAAFVEGLVDKCILLRFFVTATAAGFPPCTGGFSCAEGISSAKLSPGTTSSLESTKLSCGPTLVTTPNLLTIFCALSFFLFCLYLLKK
jgi:hypothetical protein